MRILIIFIDAIRVDKLSLYNSNIKQDTLIDKFIRRIGGEIFVNCFTSSPDTYRSLASLFTGLLSWESECNSYSKPLGGFGNNYRTIWDVASENNFKIDIFHSQLEKYIFPKRFQKYISKEINIKNFKNNLIIEDKHIVWIGLNDFRHSCYYSKYYYKKVDENLQKLGKVFEIINQDFVEKFDHVFFFSDHGILFDKEFLFLEDKKQKFQILDHRRTHLLAIYRNKYNGNDISINNSLCYLSDFYKFIINLIKYNKQSKIQNREYLICEDMDFSTMDLASKPSIFSLITKDYIYIRSFIQKIGTINPGPNKNKAYLLDRNSLKGEFILPDKNKENYLLNNPNYEKISKVYNFWLQQTKINQIIKKELNLPNDADFDSFGKVITYERQFTIFNFINVIKDIIPPIIYKLIKKYIKGIK